MSSGQWSRRYAYLVGGLGALGFFPVLPWIVQSWLGGAALGGAAAGLLTLPICGALTWLAIRQPGWRSASPAGSARAATHSMIVLGSLQIGALWLARSRPDALLISAGLLPLFALGWAWGALGSARARRLVFPLLFLWFAMPWEHFLGGLDHPLQSLSAEIALQALNAMGYGLRYWTELTIYDEHFFVIVNEECSGMNMLVTLTMYTLVFGWLTQPRALDRLLLVLLVPALAMLANGLRVATIWLLGRYGGTELAMGFWHTGSAYIIFLPVFWFLYVVGAALQRRQRPSPGR